jgi:hypothetical protein
MTLVANNGNNIRLLRPRRDIVTRFLTSGIFHESVSPKPLSIPLQPFQIFSQIRGDICSSRCTTGVVETGANGKNLQSEKFALLLLDTFG